MTDKPPIIFKCEASLWDMMADVGLNGRSAKPFDMRRWDLADERIYRLMWLERGDNHAQIDPDKYNTTIYYPLQNGWVWQEKQVSFLNKDTGELLTFEYKGVEFVDWAPGWGFLILGKRLLPLMEEP